MSASERIKTWADWHLLHTKIELRHVFVCLLILAAGLCASISVAIFINHENDQAWLLHKLSLLLFCCAFVGTTAFRAQAHQLNRQHLLALLGVGGGLIGVCALATWLRLQQLDTFPASVFFDEADNANAALRIVRNADFRPVYLTFTNLPAHYLYVIAWMFQHYGAEPSVLRYASVAFGVASVGLVFLLFRRWFSWPIALIGAFLLAVMREHLTFSRLAMHGITVPFFVLLVLYLLDRAIDRRRLFDWAMLGLGLGFSLCFYTPLRALSPFVLAILAVAGVVAVLKRRYPWQQVAAAGLVLGIGLLIAAAPFAQYVLRKPEEVFARTNEVSLLNTDKRLEKNLPQALLNQTVQHVLMFNLRGDNNPRQNLPGAPLLDPMTGVLFLIGLGIAGWQIAIQPKLRQRHLLMLSMLGLMLLPGILSLEIEAPHALRAIGSLPIAVYFACLPLAAVWQRWRERQPGGLAFTLAGLLCVLIGVYNYVWFFQGQAHDPRVLAAYSPSENAIALRTNQLIQGTADTSANVILSDNFRYQPIAEYLIQDLSRVQSWNGEGTPPITTSATHDTVLIVEPRLRARLEPVQAACPDSAIIAIPSASTSTSDPIAYELRLPCHCT